MEEDRIAHFVYVGHRLTEPYDEDFDHKSIYILMINYIYECIQITVTGKVTINYGGIYFFAKFSMFS